MKPTAYLSILLCAALPMGYAADSTAPASRLAGQTIEALALSPEHSRGYQEVTSEENPALHYVGYFDISDYLCYRDIDLTGVRSIEMEYAKLGATGRFALMAYKPGENIGSAINLGEKVAPETGGWESFTPLRVGLSKTITGMHTLCFVGVDGPGIFNMARFTLSGLTGENDGTSRFEIVENGISFTVSSEKLTGAGHSFHLEPVGELDGDLWAMDFLPDGTLVATQKSGELWLFKDGERRGPVASTPAVDDEGATQGGLMGVKTHPHYTDNGWIYLTYSHPGEKPDTSLTRVVRGKLDGLRWVEEEAIYTAPSEFYTDSNYHFGSRLAFHDGYIYFSIGDRGDMDQAQALDDPRGKIHRLHDDGRIPNDNPFVGSNAALDSIWSYGHRNPQGMAAHPQTGAIWSAEHGPMGGDEVNHILKGRNYGWPLVSHGIHYDGTVISESPHREGMESPVHQWTPSIGVSNLDFYWGEHFPRWRGHLMVGSLRGRAVHLVQLDGNRMVSDEVLVGGIGRVRDVRSGPGGYLYLLIGNPNAVIYRLVPTDEN